MTLRSIEWATALRPGTTLSSHDIQFGARAEFGGHRTTMTVVLVAFCLFGNEPVFAQDTSAAQSETVAEHRWVGFSTTMTDGAINADFGLLQGHSAMHKICADEVAPNARACFTSEVVRSIVDGRRETTGWVIPTGYALYPDPSATEGDCQWQLKTAHFGERRLGRSGRSPVDAHRACWAGRRERSDRSPGQHAPRRCGGAGHCVTPSGCCSDADRSQC